MWGNWKESRTFIRSIVSSQATVTARKRSIPDSPWQKVCLWASSHLCLLMYNLISMPNPNPMSFVDLLFIIPRNCLFLWNSMLLAGSLIGCRVPPAYNAIYFFSMNLLSLKNSWGIGKYLYFFKSVASNTMPCKDQKSLRAGRNLWDHPTLFI